MQLTNNNFSKIIEDIKNKNTNSFYVLQRHPGWGKSKAINKYMNEKQNKNNILIDWSLLKKLYKHEDITNHVIDHLNKNLLNDGSLIILEGIFDSYEESHMIHFIDKFTTIIKRKKFKKIATIITTFNTSVWESLKLFSAKNGELDENKTPNLLSSVGNDDKQKIDFKFISGEHNLTWQQIYVNYYWGILNNQKGKLVIDGQTMVMSTADVAALIICSRYWGKASFIFNTQLNYNSVYFKSLTNVFFHNRSSQKINYDEFLKNLKLPDNIDKTKLMDYLSINGDLKFNKNSILKIINDLSVMKIVNMQHFLYSIYGRQLIESQKEKLSPEKYQELMSNINLFTHSIDFILIPIIVNNGQKLLDTIKYLENL